MGKKKGFNKPANSKVNSLKNAVSDDEDDDAIESRLQSLLEDEIDQYNAQKDNALLDKAKKAKGKRRGVGGSDDEEEVYELGLTSSEDDEENDNQQVAKKSKKGFNFDAEEEEISEGDVEDDDDDDEEIMGSQNPDFGIPDSRAWGKKARMFHNTDYVDQDFGGFEGSDAEMAEQEEAEAKEIQKRLTAELDEDDFLGLIPVTKKKDKQGGSGGSGSDRAKEILKVDFDKLSIPEKRKLVERECPEVVHMLDEYKDKLNEARDLKEEMTDVSEEILLRFYQSKFHTLLNYCINISYYLYLRATCPTNCKGHPVIKRILQFRRLLDELSQFDPAKYVPVQSKLKKKKVHKKPTKQLLDNNSTIMDPDSSQTLGENSGEGQFKFGHESDGEEEGGDLEKRKITYAISKNKGLTPRRKKEQRNPRVKHREKFRKANIRRKGQVRTARTEVQKYGGEVSGIKSHLTKSVKLQ